MLLSKGFFLNKYEKMLRILGHLYEKAVKKIHFRSQSSFACVHLQYSQFIQRLPRKLLCCTVFFTFFLFSFAFSRSVVNRLFATPAENVKFSGPRK